MTKKKYDLEERTAKFGEDIIDFVRTLDRNEINRPLISQTVRCGTSIGANYFDFFFYFTHKAQKEII